MAEEAVFSFILETLSDLVTQEGKLLFGVGEQIDELQKQLQGLRWFLRDANTNPEREKRILEWVLRVRDLAYQAENLVETYVLKIASREGGGIKGKIKRFACLLNECYLRHQIGSDIDSLMSKISKMKTTMQDYGIREIMENIDGESSEPQLRRTYSTVVPEADLFVGLDDDIDVLAKILTSDDYCEMSLCGMGGIGKTTLARKIYHHPIVRKHFEGFSWICISQQWQKKDVLLGILIKLIPGRRAFIKDWRDEELVRELIKVLQEKKCLIVLDDIWSLDVWKSLQSAIPIEGRQSKVLVTTRNMEVAKVVDAHGYIHIPRLLNKDESWELLSKMTSHGLQDSEMKKLGQEIVVHCGGLPLAVVVLGGILARKSSYNEWKTVHKNVKSYLGKGKSTGEDEGDIQKMLVLSYDDLPYQLKPCFLYLSKYPEDEEIEADTLYQIWMAEGMISSKDRMGDDETMMDVAERYLGELAERCMVFVDMYKEPSIRRFKSCRLHDLMRDMCIFKAKEENFLDLVDYGKINGSPTEQSSITSPLRSSCRLAINLPTLTDVERFVGPAKGIVRYLRSFSLVMKDGYELPRRREIKLNFGEFLMLRVLTLEGIQRYVSNDNEDDLAMICIDVIKHLKLPFSISKLVHLRYFSLRDSGFGIISTSILSNLKQLQTLDLRIKGIMLIASEALQQLQLLKHLYLPEDSDLGHWIQFLKKRKLSLAGLSNLELLEGFDNRFCDSKSVSTLTNLQTLTAKVEGNVQDLGEFMSAVINLTSLRSALLQVEMKELLSLDMVREMFCWSRLTDLKLRHTLIQELPGYEVGFGQNLHSVKLGDCKLDKDPMTMLEKLPNLGTLCLWYQSYEGKEITCHALGFPQLRYLELHELYNLEKWEIEDGAMPLLSRLEIRGCRDLKMIPEGLQSITSLKKLDILSMPEEFRKRIEVNDDGEEGDDFYKVRHVESVFINTK